MAAFSESEINEAKEYETWRFAEETNLETKMMTEVSKACHILAMLPSREENGVLAAKQ